jgi:hypothetical protein
LCRFFHSRTRTGIIIKLAYITHSKKKKNDDDDLMMMKKNVVVVVAKLVYDVLIIDFFNEN